MSLCRRRHQIMVKGAATVILLILTAALVAGCSGNSAEQTRYEMEKLMYLANKIAQRINIQPGLSTTADSLQLRAAYDKILDFYFSRRTDSAVIADDPVMADMNLMAVQTQVSLARFLLARGQGDSVIAAYSRIGTDIPASKFDIAGAQLAMALAYRAMNRLDSAVVLYDRLLYGYYPPIDSLKRLNADIVAIPIDKIKIAQALKDQGRVNDYYQEAVDYYTGLKADLPDLVYVKDAANMNLSRVNAITGRWNEAIEYLEMIVDSTGRIDVPAALMIANIHNGPKKDARTAISIYREVLGRVQDSAIIGPTLLRLGSALCTDRQYDEGREVLTELKKKFERYAQLMAPAQLFYAQSFEAQGRWDRAMSELQWLMENYPNSDEAFRAARHLPEHYEREGDEKLTDIWYERAIDFYEKRARNNAGKPLAVKAYSFMADTYRSMGHYQDALETLDRIYAAAPKTRVGARALYNAASVAYKNMGDSLLAQSYLDRLTGEFGKVDSALVTEEKASEIEIESLE